MMPGCTCPSCLFERDNMFDKHKCHVCGHYKPRCLCNPTIPMHNDGPHDSMNAPVEEIPNKVVFATGSQRSNGTETVRYDLMSTVGLRRLAETYREGCKYGERNWELGQPASVVINHAMKHIVQWLDGDKSEDHLAHAAWNLFAIMHFEEKLPAMIDVPSRAT